MSNQKKPSRPAASTQAYLDIEEIREGVVILKNGSMRAVVMVSSLNFALKSEDERDAIIVSFQGFLNSLTFSIQIISHSRKIDLDEYIQNLKKIEKESGNDQLAFQRNAYREFIQGVLEEVNIMDKLFFVVVPYYPSVIEKNGLLSKFSKGKTPATNFENDKLQLMDRVDLVVSGLSSIGLNSVSLDTENLIQLYYSFYNPGSFARQKIKNSTDITTEVVQKGKDPEHMEI